MVPDPDIAYKAIIENTIPVSCDCIYCWNAEDHPESHRYFRITPLSEQMIEMCYNCGHIKRENGDT